MTYPPVNKIRIGISACLMGENVRYDGGHKLDSYIRDTLGRYFDFVPVCPETECGLGIPREAMHLEGDPSNPKLVTIKSHIDHTDRMKSWGAGKLDELAGEYLCGYIFKSRSPSSGMERIKVYGENGIPSNTGVGIWAAMFMSRFPEIPVEDEGRLNDPELRENFIERIFVYSRWKDILSDEMTPGKLVEFHTRHKLLVMSHSVEAYRALGKFVAQVKKHDPVSVYAEYYSLLDKALRLKATVKKHVNVLQHIMGYFKKVLSADEKAEILELFGLYSSGGVPLIVPVTILNHYVRKYGESYLAGQYYLNPHPAELGLRNHG